MKYLSRFLLILVASTILNSTLIFQVKADTAAAPAPPRLDGIVSSGEYGSTSSFNDGAMVVYWKVEGDNVQFALVAKTIGWLAIGFEPEQMMKGADMAIGYVDENGVAHIDDDFATGPTGPHPEDTTLGGVNSIIEYAGTEAGGSTTIEFIRPLAAADEFDKSLPLETDINIIWAVGDTDTGTTLHYQRGTGIINLGKVGDPVGVASTDPSSPDAPKSKSPLWKIHAAFMSLGFITIVTGTAIAMNRKKVTGWPKKHKLFGIISSALVLLSLIYVISLVQYQGKAHFSNPHEILGLVTFLLTSETLVLGYQITGKKKMPKILRPIHKWSGRSTVVLMLVTILAGLKMVGII
jgi:hypothetical protein